MILFWNVARVFCGGLLMVVSGIVVIVGIHVADSGARLYHHRVGMAVALCGLAGAGASLLLILGVF